MNTGRHVIKCTLQNQESLDDDIFNFQGIS